MKAISRPNRFVVLYRKALFRAIAIPRKMAKYDWTMVKEEVKPGSDIWLVQTSDNVFAVKGFPPELVNRENAKRLKSNLERHAPVDTGTLRRDYSTTYMTHPTAGRIFVISNRAPYFKFPYHYYRGEIKFNKSFIRDFVQDAIRDLIGTLGKKIRIERPKLPKKPIEVPKAPVVDEPEIPVGWADDQTIEIDRVVKESEKSILIEDKIGNQIRLPKSQVVVRDQDGKVEVDIPNWLVDKTKINQMVGILGDIVDETADAVKVRQTATKEVWLPKSKVKIETVRGKRQVHAPQWLIDEKGL